MSEWGALATPVTTDRPAVDLPWRDNAFYGVWDHATHVYGAFHVSTSPNAEGRRARASVSLDGRVVEVVEPLEPGSFRSESITFELDGRLTVRAPGLEVDLELEPHCRPVDYSGSGVFPGASDDHPMQHWQSGATVTGRVVVGGESRTLGGHGFRDRTWGFRDETAAIREYTAGVLQYGDDAMLSLMKFLRPDGRLLLEGRLLGRDGVEHVTAIDVVRDAAGLLSALEIVVDGRGVTLRRTDRVAGFWVPMGPDGRRGPVMAAYDEYSHFVADDGTAVFGLVEHGVVRTLA